MNPRGPQAPFLSQAQRHSRGTWSQEAACQPMEATSSLCSSVSQSKDNNCSTYTPDLLPISQGC